MIEIIDDFLNFSEFKVVQDTIINNQLFPWHYQNSVVTPGDHPEHSQFVHIFYDNLSWRSPFADIMLPCITKLGYIAVMRIKANLLLRTEKHIEHGFHTDVANCQSSYKTAVLYLNTNNGYTLFKDGTKVKSEENRVAIFDGSMEHTGATCTDEKTRIVINFNLFV